MSCKEKINPSKSKHYTTLERKVFLQILERYKHVIEMKKNDGATLKDKEMAWTEICATYNESQYISQERTIQQLRKLWTNLKQGQREALTKEKQACLTIGGGPPQSEANIDPDITNIAPHLEAVPILLTSDMVETEINAKISKKPDVLEQFQRQIRFHTKKIYKNHPRPFLKLYLAGLYNHIKKRRTSDSPSSHLDRLTDTFSQSSPNIVPPSPSEEDHVYAFLKLFEHNLRKLSPEKQDKWIERYLQQSYEMLREDFYKT